MCHSWLKGDGTFWKFLRPRRLYLLASLGVFVGCDGDDDDGWLKGLEMLLSAIVMKHSLGNLQSVKQLDVPLTILSSRSASS